MLRLLALFPLLLPAALFAQLGSTAFLFKSLTERDGLPYRTVRCLHFDRFQRLWIGTEQGLAWYDAGVLKEVQLDPDELPPTIHRIAEDSAGMLWLATTHGLSRVDPRTHAVRNWTVPTKDTLSGFPEGVNALFVGADQRVHCATSTGVLAFDPVPERFDSTTFGDKHGLGVVVVIRTDSAGTGCWLSSSVKGLAYFSSTSGRFYHKDDNPADMPLLRGLSVGSMVSDAHGNLWMADSRTYELLCYSPGDRSLRRWKHIPGHPDIGIIGWSPLRVDALGRIWLMDHMYMPAVFDPVDSTVHHLRNVAHDPGSIGGNVVLDMALDAAGNTWLGTDCGISVLAKEGLQYSTTFTAHLLRDRVDATLADMQLDREGMVWTASELGLIRYDPRTGEVRKFMVSDTGDPPNAILGLQRIDDELWLATRDGLWRFDLRTYTGRKFTAYPEGAERMLSTVYAWVVEDPEGAIWAGTWGRGVVRVAPDHASCRFFEPDDNDPYALPEGILACAFVARDGTLWMGHGAKGLVRYDRATDRFRTIPLSTFKGRTNTATVLAIREDPSGRLWLGIREAGLVRFDPSTRRYELFGHQHGLRMPTVATVLVDKLGRVWVGTNNELACFDPTNERFVAMPIDHGADHNDFHSTCIELPDGDFLFANSNTFVRFAPLSFQVPPAPEAPSLREVHVYGQRLAWLPGDTLLFSYQQDQVDLRFGTTAPPGKITAYAYQLEGTSREWTTGPNSTASFNNLAPGGYTLLMKVMDRWGNWSQEARTSFFIAPPWWERGWVRIAFAVLLALSIVGVFRYRLGRIRKQEQRRNEVERAMDELKLQALRAQMDPHFIFNCLNSIDRYIMTEEKQKASHYLGRFARLIRLILQQSDKVTVPLEREVEMLRYYLELEALRFETPFTWEVKVDPLLANEAVELPTMLVQPFVENAIWHGVQHKPIAGRVEIAFRLVGGSVECTIEDDGIGREASKAINAQRSGVHRSMGMRVSTDRLALFRGLEERDAKVVVHDLKDRSGAALGTRVVITLPLESGSDDPGTNDRTKQHDPPCSEPSW